MLPKAFQTYSTFTLFTLQLLSFINVHIKPTVACPIPCTCHVPENATSPITIDCSERLLTTLPVTTSNADIERLDLSHNAFGPIINSSLSRMPNLQHLDLSYNGLRRLLGCTLTGMVNLKSLNLKGNRLVDLPDSLFEDSREVEFLDLSDNLLSEIPDYVFRKLPELKRADLSNNRMLTLKFGLGWQTLRNIQSIDLSNNLFQNISENSFQSAVAWPVNIKRTLSLANCRLTSIDSPALEKIPNLNGLDLSGNTELPSQNVSSVIKELENKGLERLSLSRLNITSINSLFIQVSRLSLKFLNLSSNQITQIPARTFETISSLRTLDLSGNKLSSLTEGFSDLGNIRFLDLSHNKLSSFKGASVSSINKLKKLNVSFNDLSSSSDIDFSPLTKLTHLYAHNNRLSSVILPSSSLKLKVIDFHSNGIRHFDGVDNAPNLEYFDISDNDIDYIKEYLFGNSDFLKLVNFSNNSVNNLSTNAFLPKSAITIDLSNNFLKTLQYSNWVATQVLFLSHNRLEQMDIQTFNRMNGLKTLDLSQNKLTYLHEDLFKSTTSLLHLNLAHNQLSQSNFLVLFRALEKLQNLDLSSNNITGLNGSMLQSLQNLQHLSITKNHIEVIKPIVFRDLKYLKSIDLSGNKFSCGCKNLGFKDWLSRTSIDIVGLYAPNSSAYVCRGPAHRVGIHVTDWSPDQFECDKAMLYMIICGVAGTTIFLAGVVSTIAYRCYKCHKRRNTEKEKSAFLAECYASDYDEDPKKKEHMIEVAEILTKDLTEDLAAAIERRERRSFRRAELMNKEKSAANSNGYIPWPSHGVRRTSVDVLDGENIDKVRKDKSERKRDKSRETERKGSIEARQFDRILESSIHPTSPKKKIAPNMGKDIRHGEEYDEELAAIMMEDVTLKVQRRGSDYAPPRHDWRSRNQYFQARQDVDLGYETEPAVNHRHGWGDRYSGRHPVDRWRNVDYIWARDGRGWVMRYQGQGQGEMRPIRRDRSRERYMTLPIRDQDLSGRGQNRRKIDTPRLYLDPFTNELRFDANEREIYDDRYQSDQRYSHWDQCNGQQRQKQRVRSRSLHQLTMPSPKHQHINGGRPIDVITDRYHGNRNSANNAQSRSNIPWENNKLHLIRSRAASQPYLASQNTSDWL